MSKSEKLSIAITVYFILAMIFGLVVWGKAMFDLINFYLG